jgi:hypothetical protein
MLTALTSADGLDAAVVDRGVGRMAGACADAHRSDPILVDARQRRQMVDHRADVFRTHGSVFQLARLAGALALVGRVVGDGDEAPLGQLLGIGAGRLLLHPAARMGHHDCGVLSLFIEALREVDDRGHGDRAVVRIGETDLSHSSSPSVSSPPLASRAVDRTKIPRRRHID